MSRPHSSEGRATERRDRVVSADAAEFLAFGKRAMDARDHSAAITAFRKSAYLDPEQPMGHFHLGLALEASGDVAAARRAYAAARNALDGCEAEIEESLEGYHVDELARLLDKKLAGTP